jgi:hypothetical protein
MYFTWYMVHGTWYIVHSTWYTVHGTCYMYMVEALPLASSGVSGTMRGCWRSKHRISPPVGSWYCMPQTEVWVMQYASSKIIIFCTTAQKIGTRCKIKHVFIEQPLMGLSHEIDWALCDMERLVYVLVHEGKSWLRV